MTQRGGYYTRIAGDLRRRIVTQELPVGSRLPSEGALCTRYGVSRMTARHAVSVLEREGLVYRVQGKGTFVARNKVMRPLDGFSGLYDDLVSQGLHPGSKVLRLTRRLGNDLERTELDLGVSPEVWDVRRIRAVDGVPIAVQEFVVPVDVAPRLDEIDLATQSFYGHLKDNGVALVAARQRIEAVSDAEVSGLLQAPSGTPLLRVERLSYTADDRAVEYLVSSFLGDAYAYEVSLGPVATTNS